jgi:hypothetical protein
MHPPFVVKNTASRNRRMYQNAGGGCGGEGHTPAAQLMTHVMPFIANFIPWEYTHSHKHTDNKDSLRTHTVR